MGVKGMTITKYFILEQFRTSIFEKSKERSRKRLLYNLGIFGAIVAIWVLYFIGFPIIGLKTSIGFSIVMLGIKLYDDKAAGITAYYRARNYLKSDMLKHACDDLKMAVLYREKDATEILDKYCR
jgi:hypothetical protein